MTNEHRTDIRDAAESDTARAHAIVRAMATGDPYVSPDGDEYDETPDPWDVFALEILDVEIWAPLSSGGADLDRARLTFLLGVGGPTVSVDVDTARETVTYRHSWGMDGRGGDRTELDLWAEDSGNGGPWHPDSGPGAPWLALAADIVDGYR